MREPQNTLRAVESGSSAREYVEFWPAGTMAKGRFRCTACGASLDVKFVLPRCGQCDERLWEREESSPYAGVS
ncbi:MAG: hypothetical protein ACJ74D_08675 [Gaiellaceae bacterium]|jgi:predicted RNA-binding Zn-ribbon protein involved in translation (DUF1610 family)